MQALPLDDASLNVGRILFVDLMPVLLPVPEGKLLQLRETSEFDLQFGPPAVSAGLQAGQTTVPEMQQGENLCDAVSQ